MVDLGASRDGGESNLLNQSNLHGGLGVENPTMM